MVGIPYHPQTSGQVEISNRKDQGHPRKNNEYQQEGLVSVLE